MPEDQQSLRDKLEIFHDDVERVLQQLSKRPAQVLLYGSVVYGIACLAGVPLAPEVHLIGSTIGLNVLSNMLERVAAKKSELTDQDFDELQRGIDQQQIAAAGMTLDEFNRQLVQLVRHIDLQHEAILDAFDGVAKREQAEEILRLLRQLITTPQPPAAVRCNGVPLPDRFVGRGGELTALEQALADSDAVAITAVRGIGGIGKSTLAKEFAKRDERFKLKLWAELGQVASEDLLPRTLRDWTGAEFPPEWTAAQMTGAARSLLTTRVHDCGDPVLLLIDDVWIETVPIARQLRDAAPLGARVLITTRSEDAAAALDAKTAVLDALPKDQGAALMIDLIGAQAERLRADLETLSAALGGHPLALALAARQLRRNFNPGHVDRVIERLTRGVADGDDFKDLKLDAGDSKLDSVSATLRLTLDNLSEQRRAQFRALGALALDLPFRAAHAKAVCDVDDDEGSDMLADFAAEGLIAADPARADWYSQHRLLRAYARALLREQGELDAAEARHWAYLIALADEGFEQPPETWRALDDDLAQIHALGNDLAARLAGTDDPDGQDERLRAMSDPPSGDSVGARRAAPSPDADLLQACENFAAAVYNYIFGRYVGAEGRRWLWTGLTAARARENQSGIRLFTSSLGIWHNQHGDYQTALAYHEQSLAAAGGLGDKQNEAYILNNIGKQWSDLGENQKALEYYEQSLILKRELDDKGGEAASLSNIGIVWQSLGDQQKALDHFQQALPLSRKVGDKAGEAVTLNNIGGVWRQLGDNPQALDYFQQALPVFQEVGDIDGEAVARYNIALILWGQGRRAEALEHMQTARDLKARIGISTADENTMLSRWRGQFGAGG